MTEKIAKRHINIQASNSKEGDGLVITVIWADSVCLYRSLDERARESRKTKVDKVLSGFVDILRSRSESA